jgi:hypothetical protein
MLNIQSATTIILTLFSITAHGQYLVTADPSQLSELTVTLQLPRGAEGPRKLNVRGTDMGVHAQIDTPRCGRRPLRMTNDRAWVAPRGCDAVTWFVRPRAVHDGEAIVSDQATLLFANRWVLLSEPASLLRIADDKATNSLTIQTRSGQPVGFGATPLVNQHWRVSSTNNAPEFFVVGDIAPTTRSIGPFDVRYLSDDPSRVERLGLEVLHERALGFLAKVLPPPADLPANERSLLVVWVGVKETKGQSGGSAGSRSFVANYLFGEPRSDPANAAHSLLILSHEQFHQLADLARGPLPPLPTWLSESLASYYGLKALSVAATGATADSIRARFIDPARPVTEGLLSLARRHAAGDMSVYPMFYSQGASFWAAVDESLQRNSTEPRTLDALIPLLLRSSIGDSGALPDELVAELRRSLGDRADAIINKYVGI